jgi:hypothetical protein
VKAQPTPNRAIPNGTAKTSKPIPLLSATAIARETEISVPTILKYARAGKIPVAMQVGKVWRFRLPEVLAALQFNPQA